MAASAKQSIQPAFERPSTAIWHVSGTAVAAGAVANQGDIMNTDLTVTDPLAEQEVTILITLPSSDQPRDERPVLMSVGVSEQLPVIKNGLFGKLAALIDAAWAEYGVRTQVAEGVEDKTVVEAQVVATATVATANIEDDEPTTTPRQPTPPKPQAQNLSLF